MLFNGSLGTYTNQFAETCKSVSDLLLPQAAQARFFPPPKKKKCPDRQRANPYLLQLPVPPVNPPSSVDPNASAALSPAAIGVCLSCSCVVRLIDQSLQLASASPGLLLSS